MKRISTLITMIALLPGLMTAARVNGRLGMDNVDIHKKGDRLQVNLNLILDSLNMKGQNQFFVTPVVTDGNTNAAMPAVMINGRNMHIAYQRGTIRSLVKRHDVAQEVERHNGRPQSVPYSGSLPFEPWMLGEKAGIVLDIDTCGCGIKLASGQTPLTPLGLTPDMRLAYLTPKVTELPVTVHEGRARVQFEVDKTVLHAEPYTCRNGQKIDNRAQLRMIDDSVHYALTDPNVEIAAINITGYASPESPYLHNEFLATNRSRALAEYLAAKYNLPADRSHYDAVPENWMEFRQQVADSKELTDRQRADLLELIDRPTYGPGDFDAKEKELKTSPKFAALYKKTILPEWFPRLRATKFAIHTRLKPMSDRQLAEVIRKTPELLSLNQMFRVARLYPEGSPEFNEVIRTALKYYPDDAEANLNAAVAAMNADKNADVKSMLDKAGDSLEAINARGVYLARQGRYEEAAELFRRAATLPEAAKNLNQLP